LPGRLARQTCPADLPGRLARQTCPVDLPGKIRGEQIWLVGVDLIALVFLFRYKSIT
jgi:hypothetical protein